MGRMNFSESSVDKKKISLDIGAEFWGMLVEAVREMREAHPESRVNPSSMARAILERGISRLRRSNNGKR